MAKWMRVYIEAADDMEILEHGQYEAKNLISIKAHGEKLAAKFPGANVYARYDASMGRFEMAFINGKWVKRNARRQWQTEAEQIRFERLVDSIGSMVQHIRQS